MEIINNRYKISECLEADSLTSKYMVIDLIQDNRKAMLYLLRDSSYMKSFINYCVHSFYQVSSLNHKNVIKLMSFGIIETIDDKRIDENIFYYTTELIDFENQLDHSLPLTKEEILIVYTQLAHLLDYLHFHGIIYKYINLENLILFRRDGKLEVRLKDLVTVHLMEIVNKYRKTDLTGEEAPELVYGIDVEAYTDIYSLGAIIYQLYTNEEFRYYRLVEKIEDLEINRTNPWELGFFRIIQKSTKLDFAERHGTIHQMNQEFQRLYEIDQAIENKKEIESLNLKTPLIGRDSELKSILSLRDYWDRYQVVLLHGSKGIGKTRLINETKYQMMWSHIHVFQHGITIEKNSFYQTIHVLLKKVIRIASPNVIHKYAEELVKLVPEIGINKSITPSRELREDREILRLYDRMSNFIIEAIGNHPTMLIIDDFHEADNTFVEFIDYFIKLNHMKKAPLIILISFCDEHFLWEETKKLLTHWGQSQSAMDIKLSRLTVEETAKMVRYILGWNKDPLRFATRIMKETEGNPVLIEEALKELYAQKVLYVDYSGHSSTFSWKSLADDYTKIKLPENLDDAVINLLHTLDEKTIRVLEIVSLFSTSVSREIIAAILGKEEDYFPYLTHLTQLKVLNEKLEDWGYTYGFYRYQLKSYIYDSMDTSEKIRLHNLVSTILEEQYNREGRENKEELIYHLFQSNQRDKAVYYCVEAGDNMYNLKVYTQAMVFYRRAYELLKTSVGPDRFQLLLRIGEVYQNQGNNQNAIDCFQEILEFCAQPSLSLYVVEARCRIAQIYINRNELEQGKLELELCLKLAYEINYDEGILKAGYLLSRVYMHQKEVDKMEAVCEEWLLKAQQMNRYDYMGMLLSQKGVVAFFRGEILKAREFFQASITYLEKGNRMDEVSRPINNMGVILQDHFLNVKEAREYFERAAKIAQQYHRMDDLFRAQNNIADSYMQEAQYEKAIEVLHNNVGLAVSYEDEQMKLLGYSNLMTCYTLIGEYRQAYQYVLKSQNEFAEYPINAYLGEAFFESMAHFYMGMGDYEKTLEITPKFHEENAAQTGIGLVMRALDYFSREKLGYPVEPEQLLTLLEDYSDTPFIKERREVLHMAVEYFYEMNQIEQAKQLLDQEETLVESFDNDRLRIKRKFLSFLLQEGALTDPQYWEEILADVIDSYDKEMKWQIYSRLAYAWFDRKDYYRATSYYLNGLEVIQSLLKRTPKEYKLSYLKVKDKYKIRQRLLEMEKIIHIGEVRWTPEEGMGQINLSNFFDVSRFQELFRNPAFYELALQQYKSLIALDIDSIDSLVAALTNDVVGNLSLICKLAGKHVLASRGALLGASEEGYQILASFGPKIVIEEISYLLEKTAVSQKGMLIENHLSQVPEVNGVYLNREARGMICLPIMNSGKTDEGADLQKQQFTLQEKTKIIGYLYLETDKVFNNFSQDTYRECQKLLPLACLMINNYELQISSSMDKMTGTYTRKTIEKILQETIDAAQAANLDFSIIMCDIDHFKNINDTYGHQRGDMVLTGVGRVIHENIEGADYVGRYGGEEFIILLPGTNKVNAYHVAEKIRKSFQNAKLLGEEQDLTISFGVSSCPEDGLVKELLIERADQALYHAKEQGRNRTILWEEGIGFTDKRTDKLAGIITGNVVQDQRNVLVLAEAVEILTENRPAREKIFIFLGRLIEILEAEEGIIFSVKGDQVTDQFYRKRFIDDWVPELGYNPRLIDKAIKIKQGDYLIDWEDISQIDIFSGTPNWKSVVVVPIIYNGVVQGVINLSVSVKEKEFDFSAYNLVKITSNIIGPILETLEYQIEE